MNVQQFAEWEVAGETEVTGGNQSQDYFLQHKSQMTWYGIDLGPPRQETGDNRLRHSTTNSVSH